MLQLWGTVCLSVTCWEQTRGHGTEAARSHRSWCSREAMTPDLGGKETSKNLHQCHRTPHAIDCDQELPWLRAQYLSRLTTRTILKNQALEQRTSHRHELSGHGENPGIPKRRGELPLPRGSALHQPVERDVVPCLCFYGVTLPAGSHPAAPTS